MNIEHRTSNIERPTSNNEFCRFKKNEQAYSAEMAMKAGSESTLRNSTDQYSAVFRSRLQRDSLVLK